jgi:acyl-CoA synthetase (AMP-forming)/AMP-acid ligase II
MKWVPPQRLVHESLLASAQLLPNKEVLADATERLTYAELEAEAVRFATALQRGGLRRGDRVVLYLDNSATCVKTIFGVLMAGGVISVVNSQTKLDKLAFILNNCEASALVTGARTADIAAAAVATCASVQQAYCARDAEAVPPTFADLGEAIASTDPDLRDPGTIPSDLAALVYTSGTTGQPKGVMMTHGSLVFSVGSIAEYLRLEPDDRILSVLPLAFTYGLSQLLLTARLGATLLLERSFAFPSRTLARIRAEQATVFPAVPTVFVTITGMVHENDFPSVRCLTNAAAGLPPVVHEPLRHVFPNAKLYRMYGQTECIRVCYLEPDLVDEKPTSVGKAIPGTEAFVLDEESNPVRPGEVGVLHVRGPHVMAGYWRAPELTAEVLREGPIPGERLHCTRDYFTVDEDGDLYFVDRSDDIIKTRGEKVSSVEVENAIYALPGVRLAAVIGVPDDLLGQAVRAYVVLEDDVRLSAEEIRRACRANLESFMVPRDVILVEALPHTDSGKIRKKSLAEAVQSSYPD